MMNARRITLILGLVLALLIFTIPATGEPEQSVIVDGADVIISTSISSEQGLLDAVGIAGPRVVVEFSNHVRRMSLVVAPDLLPSLEQMSERVSVEFANAILRESLAAVPTGFQAVLDQVPERVVFEFANANLSYLLSLSLHFKNLIQPIGC